MAKDWTMTVGIIERPAPGLEVRRNVKVGNGKRDLKVERLPRFLSHQSNGGLGGSLLVFRDTPEPQPPPLPYGSCVPGVYRPYERRVGRAVISTHQNPQCLCGLLGRLFRRPCLNTPWLKKVFLEALVAYPP